MILATSYTEIQRFPLEIIPYTQEEYQKIHHCYQTEIPLEQHTIKEIGGFVLLEKPEELEDLSPLGLIWKHRSSND